MTTAILVIVTVSVTVSFGIFYPMMKILDIMLRMSKDIEILKREVGHIARNVESQPKRRYKMRLKWQAVLAIVVILLVLGIARYSNAYTYDGVIDPVDVNGYHCINVGIDRGASVFACNKELNQDEPEVFVWVYRQQIVQIMYKIDDVPHIFKLNSDDHYEQIEPPVEKEVKESV